MLMSAGYDAVECGFGSVIYTNPCWVSCNSYELLIRALAFVTHKQQINWIRRRAHAGQNSRAHLYEYRREVSMKTVGSS